MQPIILRALRPSTTHFRSLITTKSTPTLSLLTRTYATDNSGPDIGPGKTHTLDSPAKDVQAESSHKARDAKQQGSENSSATQEKDIGNHNERAQKDHPEAPGPVLGMNDERGGKGH